MSKINKIRSIRGNWLARGLSDRSTLDHPAHIGGVNAYRVLQQFTLTGGGGGWSRTSERTQLFRNTDERVCGKEENSLGRF